MNFIHYPIENVFRQTISSDGKKPTQKKEIGFTALSEINSTIHERKKKEEN